MRRARWLVPLTALIALTASPSAARADPYELCIKAQSAFQKVERCSAAIATSRDRKRLERAYLRRGNAFIELNRFADAVDDFSELIRINPNVAGYYDNRLNALRSLGRYDEALRDANATIRLAPTYAFTFRSRANVYADMGSLGPAIADYSRAISMDPGSAGLLIDRGKAFAKASRNQDAIADFSRALDLDSRAHAALRERGLLYLKIGKYDAALDDLTLYARLEPADQEVQRALDEIQRSNRVPPGRADNNPERDGDRRPSDAEKGASSGTGFFVTAEGHVITNAHVVEGCSAPKITWGLASPVTGRVLTRDGANDLALIKSDLKPNATASLRAGVKIGEGIATFGYPLVGLLSTKGNFTTGNVSALTGMRDDTRFLQISAPVQPGNSGGPMLDQAGNVVGVVVSKLNAIKVAEAIDDVPQNVNFAIKTSVLMNFLDVNGVSYAAAGPGQAIDPAALAEKARAISVFIVCEK